MIVSITGHRPDKLGGYNFYNPVRFWIRERIRVQLRELCPRYTITGMALGVDQDFAYVCIEERVPFLAAVPFAGQETRWPTESQRFYKELLARAWTTVIVCQGEYTARKMQIRNEYMVNNCDVLLAVWDGTDGGTANCFRYAVRIGKRVIRIDPREAL